MNDYQIEVYPRHWDDVLKNAIFNGKSNGKPILEDEGSLSMGQRAMLSCIKVNCAFKVKYEWPFYNFQSIGAYRRRR
jgi:hypothetical protein